ncbi:hypothetical protein ANN_08065 [Periplaneta americana]|uniref:Uncharacterized protein n=1 Tax=Periplaneta americana TaxID=6978 RepID=A0ABQ8T0F1_PERAM|nr:hypothetical protein ANN_08065 [Periplaneta americana]
MKDKHVDVVKEAVLMAYFENMASSFSPNSVIAIKSNEILENCFECDSIAKKKLQLTSSTYSHDISVPSGLERLDLKTYKVVLIAIGPAPWRRGLKASSLEHALRNARWFESSWGKKFSHEISGSVWDRCPPSIVMHLGSYDR